MLGNDISFSFKGSSFYVTDADHNRIIEFQGCAPTTDAIVWKPNPDGTWYIETEWENPPEGLEGKLSNGENNFAWEILFTEDTLIPEPSALILAGLGVVGLGAYAKRKLERKD